MRYRYILLICLSLLLNSLPSQAQQLWQRQYGDLATENFAGLLGLHNGTYLLSGTVGTGATTPVLYLVHTDAQGDTIWTRRRAIRGYTNLQASSLLCEDDAGRVLLAGRAITSQGSVGFLACFSASTGDTLWTRPLGLGSDYTDIAFGPDRNFVLLANHDGHPQLSRLTPAGQVVQQLTVDYSSTQSGTATRLARATDGYWVAVQAGEIAPLALKLVLVSDAGVRGIEYAGPALNAIRGLLPVENGCFLLVTSSQINKVSPTFTPLWEQYPPRIGLPLSYVQARHNTNGDYVLVSTASTSHFVDISMITYSAEGTFQGVRALFSTLNRGPEMPVQLWVDATTGRYLVGTSFLPSTPTANGVDFTLAGFTGAVVTATNAVTLHLQGQLYPNPVNNDQPLTLRPATSLVGHLVLFDTQGHTVRTWPAAGGAVGGLYRLPLRGLAAGLYFLHTTDTQQRGAALKVVKL